MAKPKRLGSGKPAAAIAAPARSKASPAPAPAAAAAPAAPPPKVRVPPLFRPVDWLTLLLAFGVIWIVYFLTLAPELTLEDSGELVTGSYYAGIPHPPGYPVWTIYSSLWANFIPWGNPAWRVALGEATLGALACGLLGLMVSRGSSLFMEGIEDLKSITGKWENAICLVSGLVAGLLLGLDGFMWRESVAVNRIAVTSVPWFLIVQLCILRWIYAPHQYRFLCWALFIFGICYTTHQSLIVAAIGIEVAIAARNPRLGRDVFFGNVIIYMMGNLYVLVSGQYVLGNLSKAGMQFVFHLVGIGSMIACSWLATRTQMRAQEAARNMAYFGAACFLELALLKKEDSGVSGLFAVCALGSLAAAIYMSVKTWSYNRDWLIVGVLGALFALGASFYLYLPISGMTNPPMQWGYPRTVEGFWHAITRGQYEQPTPVNPLTESGRFVGQLGMLIAGAGEEFTWVYLFIAVVPFLFFLKMQKRERAWIIGMSAIYLTTGVLLIILLNPTPDRASKELVKVFFNNSHTVVAAFIGYGLALTAAYMATHYARFRRWGLIGGSIAVVLACYFLVDTTRRHYFGEGGSMSLSELPHWIGRAFAPNQYGLPIYASLILILVPLAFVVALLVYNKRGPLAITLGLYLAMPLYSGLAHWYGSDQRDHYFGYWFGHDMFSPPYNGPDGKPLYPPMAKNAVLYGGTDPGRFCPTYMIFCESFTPHNCQPKLDQTFDRRDVYIITQNAVADGTYLNYVRAHYNRSKQIDPPFFQELFRSADEKKDGYRTNFLARMVGPLDRFFTGLGERIEKRRRTYTSWFEPAHFTDLPGLAARLQPGPSQDALSKYIYDHLRPETQKLLSATGNSDALRRALAEDLNRLLERELEQQAELARKLQEEAELDAQIGYGSADESVRQRKQKLAAEVATLSKIDGLYDAERFKSVAISDYLKDFITQNPQSHTRIRLNRLLLEAAYAKEIAASIGGVYPDREIKIATPDESAQCFNFYYQDAAQRYYANKLKPGEEVKVENGRVSIGSSQVTVMALNGLITKVMFDNNPQNEFYVEESFPMDWMYPHLTPFGIIMKVNREEVKSITKEMMDRDHNFWKQFSKRLTGDFIDYDTPVKEVTDWVEKTYLRRDLNGFTGDRKFVHDEDAQKAFSKLRSSIGGIYYWRLGPECPVEFRPRTMDEAMAISREADFTFKQAFAFCPYSPEAMVHYINILMGQNRMADALLVAETSLKFDPENGQTQGFVRMLRSRLSQAEPPAVAPTAPRVKK